MTYQPFLIKGFVTGLDTDTQPWLLPQDAFQTIFNGFVRHGVLEKRAGMQTMSWFVNSASTTVVSITNANPGVVTLASGVGLANGDRFQIRNATGMTEVNGVTYQIQGLAGAQFNLTDIYGDDVDTTSFGAYVGAGEFFLVPEEPIMGIKTFIDTNTILQILIFNTKRAAIFNSGTNQFDPLDVADIFDGTPSSFINSASFGKTSAFATSTFFFTNFNGDVTLPISPMRTFTTGSTTSTFAPDSTPTAASRNYINAAQWIFSARQRLLLINTVEGTTAPAGTPPIGSGTNFAQRMRWSDARNPNAWDQITPGIGGFVDAPTSETIISAKQLQDVIIVYFTYSVWSIEPTSDPALPFRWVKINAFRACDAPYATLGYDRYCAAFGQRGITSCDRVDVQRIDDKIQDFMATTVNLDFVERMYSERNFVERRSWTLYPSAEENLNPSTDAETSNFALIRTEEELAWSIFSVFTTDIDSVNGINLSCLGFSQITQDLAYQDLTGEDDVTFDEYASRTWSSFYFQGKSEVFLGGDQIGRLLFLEKGGDDIGEDIPFYVTSAGWNPFKDQGIPCQMGYVDFYIDADLDTQWEVDFYVDDIETPYATQKMDCLPNLGFICDIQGITMANPISVTAYSHGIATGTQVFIYDLEGAGQVTGGPYTVTSIGDNSFTIGVDGTGFEPYISGGQVVLRGFQNTKCWKRAYAGGKGYQHYIRITNKGNDDVLRFNAFMPWFQPSGIRMIGG